MTGSEALGMLLGKEIYDSVKNKINADDCYEVMKAMVLSELDLFDHDNLGVLSESVKHEIREEIKMTIIDMFFDEKENEKFFNEQILNAFKNNKKFHNMIIDALKKYDDEISEDSSKKDFEEDKYEEDETGFTDEESADMKEECDKCSCKCGEYSSDTESKTKPKTSDNTVEMVEALYEILTGKKLDEDGKKIINEANVILLKLFDNKNKS